MMFAVDFAEDLFGEPSSCRGRGRLKPPLRSSKYFDQNEDPYRCLRRGVDRSSSTIVDTSGEIVCLGEADVNDRERMVEGVEDVVESIELRSC